jgi:hypothetical protein
LSAARPLLLAGVLLLAFLPARAEQAKLLSEHLVVFSGKAGDDAQGVRDSLDRAVALLRELADARVEVFQEKSGRTWWAKPLVTGSDLLRSHFGMEQLLRLPQNREQRGKLPPDFEMPRHPAIDILVFVDLPRAPGSRETEVIRRARDELAGKADVSVSLSRRYLVYESRETGPEDDRLVFLVPWRIGEEDGARTQRYWREEHGPLAHRLIQEHGHEEMKRYEQIQTDRGRSTGVFDARRQGLAMQYVPSMKDALAASLTNLEAACTNTELAIDELNFTQGPSLLFFENVSER